MQFEIMIKDRNSTTVTIAKDRTSVKISNLHAEEVREQILAFVRLIESEIRERFSKTMRGMFSADLSEIVFQDHCRNVEVKYQCKIHMTKQSTFSPTCLT